MILIAQTLVWSVGCLYAQNQQNASELQKGIVRSVVRPSSEITYLSGVTLSINGRDSEVMSGDDGSFEILISKAEPFYLSSIRKEGYELINKGILGYPFMYSANTPIDVAMFNLKDKGTQVSRMFDDAYAYAEKAYVSRVADLRTGIKEKVMSERSYLEQLQKLQRAFEMYEALIRNMSEHYVLYDYANADTLNASINMAVEAGNWTVAESLLSKAGSLDREVKNLNGRAASSKYSLQALADLLYSKYSVCLLHFDVDSASYYIKLRAELDTTNIEWQLDAGGYIVDDEQAMSLNHRALRNALMLYGENHPYVAMSYSNIGSIYDARKDYNKALEYYERSMEQFRSYDDNCSEIVTLYDKMQNAYFALGEYFKAIEYIEYALELLKSMYDENHPDVAVHYGNLGACYEKLGNFAAALENYECSLSMLKSRYGENHPDVATIYNNIGGAYYDQGEYSKALEYYERSLSMRNSIYGENYPDVATSYNNIGNVYSSQGDNTKALEYYERSLSIGKSIYGENHPDVATIYNNIGGAYSSQGE